MSKKKVDTTYYLNENTVAYIKEYGEEEGIKPSHALERIVAEHQNQNHDLLEQIKGAVKEVVHEDLGRIRAGTNLADKHTRMLLQFANHYFAVNKFKELATKNQYKSRGIIQAEEVVKDEISNARMKKIERQQGTSNLNEGGNEYAWCSNKKSIQDYMGNDEKTSSLFTKEEDVFSLDGKNRLKEAFEKAQKNKSVLWQDVISFDNEWLEKHGIYDS